MVVASQREGGGEYWNNASINIHGWPSDTPPCRYEPVVLLVCLQLISLDNFFNSKLRSPEGLPQC